MYNYMYMYMYVSMATHHDREDVCDLASQLKHNDRGGDCVRHRSRHGSST